MSGLLTAWRRDTGLAMPRPVVVLAQAGGARLAHRRSFQIVLLCVAQCTLRAVLCVASCDNSLYSIHIFPFHCYRYILLLSLLMYSCNVWVLKCR